MSHNMSSVLTSSLKIPYFETMQELSELTRLSPRLLYCLSKKLKTIIEQILSQRKMEN